MGKQEETLMTHKARVAVVKEQVREKEKQKRQRLAAGVLIATAFLAGAALCRWGQPMGG